MVFPIFASMNKLPSAFLERMQAQLNTDFDCYLTAYSLAPEPSIRLNPKKRPDEFEGLESVDWYDEGKYLKEKRRFITDPLWHAGTYYVQEASSMFLAEIFKQLYSENTPKNALDLCAAPGGKSTLLQTLLHKNAVLTANEVIKTRTHILKENHIRAGISENIIITQNDPEDFRKLNECYDYVQIDAPCSGEGMFRKEPNSLKEWSTSNGKLCAERQKRILADVYPALSKNAFLVYSTCTFNPDENEKLIDWACDNFEFESVQLKLKPEWKIIETEYNGIYGYYFYPHRVRGEGFFVSVIKKTTGSGLKLPYKNQKKSPVTIAELIENENIVQQNNIFNWETNELSAVRNSVSDKLNIIYSGLELGELKGKNFIPSQALANFHFKLHHFPEIEIGKDKALAFLRGSDPEVDVKKAGIYLLTFKGFGLGWIKFIGSRSNNYYPKPWRIKNF